MTAKDLLYKVLDYQYLWVLPHNIDSKPAKIRLNQIEALLDAFNLSKKYVNPLVQAKYFIIGNKKGFDRAKHLNDLTNLDYYRRGEFLKDRSEDKNKFICDKIISDSRQKFIDLPEDLFITKTRDISWLFNDLLNYRQEIYKVTHPWGGMLEGFSLGLYYSKHLQTNLNETIKNHLEEIDDMLWLITDLDQRNIDLDELIDKHKYIEADLEKIDLEWRMENY